MEGDAFQPPQDAENNLSHQAAEAQPGAEADRLHQAALDQAALDQAALDQAALDQAEEKADEAEAEAEALALKLLKAQAEAAAAKAARAARALERAKARLPQQAMPQQVRPQQAVPRQAMPQQAQTLPVIEFSTPPPSRAASTRRKPDAPSDAADTNFSDDSDAKDGENKADDPRVEGETKADKLLDLQTRQSMLDSLPAIVVRVNELRPAMYRDLTKEQKVHVSREKKELQEQAYGIVQKLHVGDPISKNPIKALAGAITSGDVEVIVYASEGTRAINPAALSLLDAARINASIEHKLKMKCSFYTTLTSTKRISPKLFDKGHANHWIYVKIKGIGEKPLELKSRKYTVSLTQDHSIAFPAVKSWYLCCHKDSPNPSLWTIIGAPMGFLVGVRGGKCAPACGAACYNPAHGTPIRLMSSRNQDACEFHGRASAMEGLDKAGRMVTQCQIISKLVVPFSDSSEMIECALGAHFDQTKTYVCTLGPHRMLAVRA